MKTEKPMTNFFDIFTSKLKEQSFIIFLMLGVIYYQHNLMEERVSFWQKEYEKQKQFIELKEDEDRKILLDRIKYLQEQQDKYVQESIQELKKK